MEQDSLHLGEHHWSSVFRPWRSSCGRILRQCQSRYQCPAHDQRALITSKNTDQLALSRSISLIAFKASAALIYDSVYFFARALSQFVEQYPFNTVPLTCEAQKSWVHGSAFSHFLKKVTKTREIVCSWHNDFPTVSSKRMASQERLNSTRTAYERMSRSKWSILLRMVYIRYCVQLCSISTNLFSVC